MFKKIINFSDARTTLFKETTTIQRYFSIKYTIKKQLKVKINKIINNLLTIYSLINNILFYKVLPLYLLLNIIYIIGSYTNTYFNISSGRAIILLLTTLLASFCLLFR